MSQPVLSPRERVQAAAAASRQPWISRGQAAQKHTPKKLMLPRLAQEVVAGTRPENQPDLESLAKRCRAARLDFDNHTSEGITPAYLRSEERSLLRQLALIQRGLADVRAQLALL